MGTNMTNACATTLVALSLYAWFNYVLSATQHQHGHFETGESMRKILVFGGNGFIGSATVERLINNGYSVYVVNRGNWYWDSETLIKPFVVHIKCDRMQILQRCSDFQDLLWNEEAPNLFFDAVIDFSGYHPFQVTEAISSLEKRVEKYIFISTDSVYDISSKNHDEPSKETDSERPKTQEEIDRLRETEDYGHRKLECEEELQLQRASDGIPYIIFRLPDVIGAKDNTYRWWIYQIWIRLNKYLDRPLAIPSRFVNQPMSLVYVNDVADVIVSSLKRGPEFYDEAYNLAFKERPTLLDMLEDIRSELNVSSFAIQEDENAEAIHLFPSVSRGPVDISKAERLLAWSPTPWKRAVHEIVTFYENAISNVNFDIPRKDIIRTMQTHFTKDYQHVLLGLKHVYNINYPEVKDEL